MATKTLALLLCASISYPTAWATDARRAVPHPASSKPATVRIALEQSNAGADLSLKPVTSAEPMPTPPGTAQVPEPLATAETSGMAPAAESASAASQLEQSGTRRPPERASAERQLTFWSSVMDGALDSSKGDDAPVPGRESSADPGLAPAAAGVPSSKAAPPSPKNNFRTRLATAAVFAPLLLFLVHWGGLPFSLAITAVTGLALHEYGSMLSRAQFPVQRVNVVLAGLGLAAATTFGGIAAALPAAVALVVLTEMYSAKPSLERAALTLFGAVFLGGMLPYLTLIRNLESGRLFSYFLILTVWNTDNFGYLVGGPWGRHKLAPYLSPKKSWEGAIAGTAAAAATALAFQAFTALPLSWAQALVLGCLISVAGQVSDLAESMVKRAVGAKDSGTLLPGHGGFMDRFDSYILAAFLMYYFLVLTT